MIYKQFSAQELYCMAELLRKNSMYGIPNGFEMFSEDELPQIKASVLDELLNKQVTTMNLDGRTVLAADYRGLVDAICDCDACLTVNYQSGEDRSEDTVLWRTGTSYLRADVIDDRFVFVTEDADSIKSYLSAINIKSNGASEKKRVTIPHIALAKAKRAAADKKDEDAKRILLQNGAGDLTDVILAGLKENADYLGLLLMTNKPEERPMQQAAYLCANGILLTLSETIVNYRNSTAFSVCSEADAAGQIHEFQSQFVVPSKESTL